MPLANSIPRRKNIFVPVTGFIFFFFLLTIHAVAQENSPYARYGLGTTVATSNVVNRGMGGVSAAYSDPLSINFNNPASYAHFQSITEEKSKRSLSGRVLLDVGIKIENKTLHQPSNAQSFSSPYGSYSHLQIGMPLSRNWGLSFGLRQLTRISYKVAQRGAILNPPDGEFIDTAYTEFTGNGGTFLPNIGTGVAIKNLSLGVTVGYMFGRREYNVTRALIDTTEIKSATYNAAASFGDLYYSGGAQYRMKLNKKTVLSLGIAGNLKQTLRASRDVIRSSTSTSGTADTVYRKLGEDGTVVYPASYTAGFVLEHQIGANGSFMFGTDLMESKWSSFRFFNAPDSVRDNWQLRVGAQLRPNAKVGSGYFSNVSYRAGFYTGPDYIHVGSNLPVYGISFGMGLPLANYNRLSPGQFTIINLSFEYEQRGNNTNMLRENLFRLSIGLNFSDLWFNKRKYE